MKKFISILILQAFIITNMIGPCPIYAQADELSLPAPGQMVSLNQLKRLTELVLAW